MSKKSSNFARFFVVGYVYTREKRQIYAFSRFRLSKCPSQRMRTLFQQRTESGTPSRNNHYNKRINVRNCRNERPAV